MVPLPDSGFAEPPPQPFALRQEPILVLLSPGPAVQPRGEPTAVERQRALELVLGQGVRVVVEVGAHQAGPRREMVLPVCGDRAEAEPQAQVVKELPQPLTGPRGVLLFPEEPDRRSPRDAMFLVSPHEGEQPLMGGRERNADTRAPPEDGTSEERQPWTVSFRAGGMHGRIPRRSGVPVRVLMVDQLGGRSESPA